MFWIFYIFLLLVHGSNIINSTNPPALLLVSTLDGRINAVSLEDSSLLWSVPIGSSGLVSTNIPVFQSADNEEDVLIIPSLQGELYEFTSRHLKPLLISPDSLLTTSYRLSDRIVVVGARTTELFSVRLTDGQILYRCSHESCSGQLNNDADMNSDVLAIRKSVLILRAVDVRTGLESWNYSVGSHDIHLVNFADTMHGRLLENANTYDNLKYNFKMQIGSNIVEVEKSDDENAVNPWSFLGPTNRKKFALSSPVAKAWLVAGNNDLKDIDFVNDDLVADDEEDVYVMVGQFNGHPYVHQSAGVTSYFRSQVATSTGVTNQINALGNHLPWQPLLFSAVSRTPLINPSSVKAEENTALARYSSPYPYDPHETYTHQPGIFYLAKKCKVNYQSLHVKSPSRAVLLPWLGVIAASFLIVILTIYLIKIQRKIFISPSVSSTNLPISEDKTEIGTEELPVSLATNIANSCTATSDPVAIVAPADLKLELPGTAFGDGNLGSSLGSENGSSPDVPGLLSSRSNPSVSRYASDFLTMNVLGRGGFGIVYQAKNKIDNMEYAVKIVPIKACHQGRAQREVRSWAMLDHANVVRFYQAWFEDSMPVQSPPKSGKDGKGGGFDDEDDDGEELFEDEGVTDSTRELSSINATSNDSMVHTEELSLMHPPSSKMPPFLDGDSSSSFVVFASNKENYDTSSVIFTNKTDSGDENITSSEIGSCRKSEPSSPRAKTNSNSSDNNALNQRIYFCIQVQLCEQTLRDWIGGDIGMKAIRSCYSGREGNMNEEQKSCQAMLIDLFSQLMCGLDHIHNKGFVHRDIKPTNIFLARNGSSLKIGDFGLACDITTSNNSSPTGAGCKFPGGDSFLENNEHFSRSEELGTRLYMSPEQTKRSITISLTPKVDIYSSGIVALELFIPFGTAFERVKSLTSLKKYCGNRNSKFPDFLIEFSERFPSLKALIVDQMLKTNPKDRPSAEDILAYAIFGESWRVTMHRKNNSFVSLNGRHSSNMDDNSSASSSP